jgi:hypothetical protein
MRPGVTWIIVVAVVVVGVFAGLDELRSSGDERPPAEASATEAVTTTQAETDVVLASSAELETRRVVGLMPGRITTNERFPPAVTFTVRPGWYGHQRGSGFVLAKSPSGTRLLARSRNATFGGVTVDTLDRRLPFVLRDIEATPSIRVHDVSRIRISGHSGRRLSLEPRGRGALRELLGLPVFLFEEEQLIVLGVGRKTLLIRWGLGSGGDPTRTAWPSAPLSLAGARREEPRENRARKLFNPACERFLIVEAWNVEEDSSVVSCDIGQNERGGGAPLADLSNYRLVLRDRVRGEGNAALASEVERDCVLVCRTGRTCRCQHKRGKRGDEGGSPHEPLLLLPQ